MTIGILGGGQLAKMLCDSAVKQNHKTVIYDPSEDACGRLSADKHICAKYNNFKALSEFGGMCDVITYEFENVPDGTVRFLQENFDNIPQGVEPLYVSQHRIREKNAVTDVVDVPRFTAVSNTKELKKALDIIGYPAVLKTCRGGYDGKGQWVFESADDIADIQDGEYILEEKVDFDMEVSCIVVRGDDTVAFPVGENIHKNGILHKTIAPARLPDTQKITDAAKRIMEHLGFKGILGIEFFVKGDKIYFNEMAPRPHNSAHYTMDACDYSQFDMLIKALTDGKLTQPVLNSPVVMINILGEDKDKFDHSKCHIYGKTDWKIGRKMGHINILENHEGYNNEL